MRCTHFPAKFYSRNLRNKYWAGNRLLWQPFRYLLAVQLHDNLILGVPTPNPTSHTPLSFGGIYLCRLFPDRDWRPPRYQDTPEQEGCLSPNMSHGICASPSPHSSATAVSPLSMVDKPSNDEFLDQFQQVTFGWGTIPGHRGRPETIQVLLVHGRVAMGAWGAEAE